MWEESKKEVIVFQAGTQHGRSSRSESCEKFCIWRVVSTLNVPIWSRCSIALTYFASLHFRRTLNRERSVQGLDERYRSSKEGEE